MMKTKIYHIHRIFRILIPAAILFLIHAVYPETFIVEPQGQISTIKEAVEKARNGDNIIIRKGIYREGRIEISKSVTISGEDWPVLDGENQTGLLLVTADDVEIRGLVIENVGTSFIEDHAGIKLDGVRNCTIENNRLKNTFFGIYLAKSEKCTLRNNMIAGTAQRESTSGNGIHLWYCKDITITNNNISGHRDGIYFEFVEDGHIEKNLSERNLRYGLHFMFSDNCRYTGNTFRHNGAGVAVMYSSKVEMINNLFEYNWGPASFGILLKEITDSRIRQNTFIKNSVGLYSEASNRNRVEDNQFIQNGWAVKIMANSMNNDFLSNNFESNAFDVATNSRQNFNTFRGNYWSTYRGYDLDQDGIGDVPYRPVNLFSYLVEQNPPALILLRSFFIDILNIAEKIIPALTPETLVDEQPKMEKII